MWSVVWMDVIEFLRVDLLGKLLIASIMGGLIGLEREWGGKPAGLRTNLLICVGSTLITDLSMDMSSIAGGPADASRLAAQIVSGIGFLGAGTIIQSRGTITGLTSAATLWVVAGIGIAIGSTHLVEAIGTTLLVLVVLLPMGHLERRLDRTRAHRLMLLDIDRAAGLERVLETIADAGLVLQSEKTEIEGDRLIVRLELRGPPEAWLVARDALFTVPEVKAMRLS